LPRNGGRITPEQVADLVRNTHLIIHSCLNALASPQFWQSHSALLSRGLKDFGKKDRCQQVARF
jgi:hypothetical protein